MIGCRCKGPSTDQSGNPRKSVELAFAAVLADGLEQLLVVVPLLKWAVSEGEADGLRVCSMIIGSCGWLWLRLWWVL